MKIVMLIAKEGFRDEEYKVPSDYFKKNNIEVDVASTEKGICTGKFGMKAEANLEFSEVNADDYDAVVLVGGPGAKQLVDNEFIAEILNQAKEKRMVIAAICFAPVILARAGILKNKKATVWDKDKLQSPILKEEGAKYIEQAVVTDGNIITADGPESAKKFAEEIVKVLG